jgi:multidrug resistance efflux pump
MMIAIMSVYLVLLFALVRLGIVAFNLFWKTSPFIVLLLLNFGLFIPMGWGAPQGDALVVRNSVAIVPSVTGEVIDVPVEANAALKEGDVLFRIDSVPYEAQVKAIEAQLKLSDLRLAQMTQLFERDSGRAFDVQQRQSEVDQLKAQLEGAKWNLDKTIVRAPADGYVTNVALRKGARVANLPLSPVMAFIDTSDTLIGVEISQNDARYIAPGQSAELTFKLRPRQGRERASGHLDGANPDLRTCSDAKGRPVDAVRGPREARRRGCLEAIAGRQCRYGCDLYGACQGHARHPESPAAAIGDPELRQSVLGAII